MCIIAYRPAGASIDRKTLETMYTNNPDGAGFMFAYKGTLYIRKGFMTLEKYLETYNAIPNSINLVLHTRIGTQGTNSAGNTHPYPVTDNLDSLKALSVTIRNGYAFAHNGILPNMRITGDYNDSQAFGVTFLAPLARLAENEPNGLQSDVCRKIIEAAIPNNRICIMSTTGYVTMYGHGWTQHEGIWYSNTTYKPYTRPTYYFTNKTEELYDDDYPLFSYSKYNYGKNRGKFTIDD